MDAPNQNSDPLKTLQMIADSSSGQLRWSSNTLSSFLDAPIRNASLYKGLSVHPSVRCSVGPSVGRYVRYTALKTLFSAFFCHGDENIKPNTIQYVLRASLATLAICLSIIVKCLAPNSIHAGTQFRRIVARSSLFFFPPVKAVYQSNRRVFIVVQAQWPLSMLILCFYFCFYHKKPNEINWISPVLL